MLRSAARGPTPCGSPTILLQTKKVRRLSTKRWRRQPGDCSRDSRDAARRGVEEVVCEALALSGRFTCIITTVALRLRLRGRDYTQSSATDSINIGIKIYRVQLNPI